MSSMVPEPVQLSWLSNRLALCYTFTLLQAGCAPEPVYKRI